MPHIPSSLLSLSPSLLLSPSLPRLSLSLSLSLLAPCSAAHCNTKESRPEALSCALLHLLCSLPLRLPASLPPSSVPLERERERERERVCVAVRDGKDCPKRNAENRKD